MQPDTRYMGAFSDDRQPGMHQGLSGGGIHALVRLSGIHALSPCTLGMLRDEIKRQQTKSVREREGRGGEKERERERGRESREGMCTHTRAYVCWRLLWALHTLAQMEKIIPSSG